MGKNYGAQYADVLRDRTACAAASRWIEEQHMLDGDKPITRSAEILSRVKQALHDPKITDSLTDCCCPDADRV